MYDRRPRFGSNINRARFRYLEYSDLSAALILKQI
jgi:hypothetical protein